MGASLERLLLPDPPTVRKIELLRRVLTAETKCVMWSLSLNQSNRLNKDNIANVESEIYLFNF